MKQKFECLGCIRCLFFLTLNGQICFNHQVLVVLLLSDVWFPCLFSSSCALPLLLHLLGHTNSRCNYSLPFFAKLIMIIMIYWLVFRIHFYF
jgi:hypothetical protein